MWSRFFALCLINAVAATAGVANAQRPVTQEERQAVVSAITSRIAELEIKRVELAITHTPESKEMTSLVRTLINLRSRLSEVAEPTFVQLPRPHDLRATPGNGQVHLEWKPVDGVKKYKVFYWYHGIEWTVAGETDTPRFTVTGLSNGKFHEFGVSVVSPGVNYQWGDSIWSKITATPQADTTARITPEHALPSLPAHPPMLPQAHGSGTFSEWMSFQQYQAFVIRQPVQDIPLASKAERGIPSISFACCFNRYPSMLSHS